ncbi:FapA family protein [Candidatus Kuenenia sp.]|uniref:FapA family protein n=1 Tax=Candidatus Kuenenia sp. TaxID=2499824 RepID=UPI00321FAEF7
MANNIKILREAIDCVIYAKKMVKAEGDRLSIAGGLVVAGTLIEVESLGSKKEIYTDVEVGVDYAAQQKQMNTRKEASDLRSALKKVDKELALLHEIKKSKGELTAKHADTFQQLLSRKEEIEKRLRDLPSGETVPVYKDAKVVVYKVVYPGVEIKIGEATMSILEECYNTTFYLFEGEIKQSP